MSQLHREPLLHFLLGGAILFGLWSWFAPPRALEATPNPRRIVVAREDVIAFVQTKTKIADDDQVTRLFDEVDRASQKDWIDRFIREEVLVREARAMGLDRGDELIRRRLAQKVEFLTLGLLEEELEVDQAELEAFYQERAEDYRIPTTVTFSHVFVRRDKDAEMRSRSLLERLNREKVSFRDAIALGDRFLYNRNYVDRTIDEVRSHFGDEIADMLKTVTISKQSAFRWTGPFESQHGFHLTLVTKREDSRIPGIEAIGPLLHEDVLRRVRETVLSKATGTLLEKYEIELSRDLAEGPLLAD